MSVERVFGVDLGSEVVGWSYFDGDRLLAAGSWRLVQHHKESWGLRWMRLRQRLDAVLDVSRYRIDLVFYESIIYHIGQGGKPNFYAAQAYGAAKAELAAWCEQRKIEWSGVGIHDIKKAATGRGAGAGTDKEAVWLAARARWPHVAFDEYDASDAAFIGLAGLIGLGLAKPILQPKAPAVKRTKKPKAGGPGPAQGELYDAKPRRRPR